MCLGWKEADGPGLSLGTTQPPVLPSCVFGESQKTPLSLSFLVGKMGMLTSTPGIMMGNDEVMDVKVSVCRQRG